MSFFNNLVNSAVNSAVSNLLGNKSQAVTQIAMGLINQNGGIGGLMQKFQQNGLGDIFTSWVGKGENQPISQEGIQKAVGSEQLQNMAASTGLDLSQITAMAAQFLPQLVDQATPNGTLPKAEQENNFLQQALGSFFK
jgi:uncharacterized protein YidB (DUF937 family)